MEAKELADSIVKNHDYDKLVELCEQVLLDAYHLDDAINVCERMTSGNIMHNKHYVRGALFYTRKNARMILGINDD